MKIVFIFIFFTIVFKNSLTQDPCIINLECESCFPEFPPTIDSHDARSGILTIHHGDTVTFRCHKQNFLIYPTQVLTSICDNGQFHVQNSTDSRFFEELSCASDYLEDIVHDVEYCGNPYQGRSYQYENKNISTTQHLAEVCYDSELGRTVFMFMSFHNKNNIVKNNHIDDLGQISVWGSFGKVFDASIKLEAEKIFTNPDLLNRMLKYNLGKNYFNFQDQRIIPTKLLSSQYFQNQNGRVTNFVSNKILMWKSIAESNFKNIQDDITYTFKQNALSSHQEVDVYVGTHETLILPINNRFSEIYLKPGKKFPIPKYVWTIVHNKNQGKALAIIVINNPFIGISEVKSSLLCPSICHSIKWLNNLKYSNNFERTSYGLVYCCDIHYFTRAFRNVPDITNVVHQGDKGLLKEP